MSADREITRIVRSWLDEGVTRLPDRALDAVLDQITVTRQRRPNWLTRRFPISNNRVRYGIAAAAIIFALILSANLLPRSVGAPPSPMPTTSPTATASPRAIHEGRLAGGQYILDDALGMTIEAAPGWTSCCGGAIFNDQEPPKMAAIFPWDITGILVYEDSCHWMDSKTTRPKGADAIAAALTVVTDRHGTKPELVSVADRRAVHVRLTVPENLKTTPQDDGDANFVDCDQLEFRTWTTAVRDGARYHQAPGQIDDFYLVDVDGQTFVFDVTYFPETPIADRVSLDAMLVSIQID